MMIDNDETLSSLLAEEARTRSEAYLAYHEAISGDSPATELHLWDAVRRHRAAMHAVLDRQRGRDTAKGV